MGIEQLERLARATARAGRPAEALELLEAGLMMDPTRAATLRTMAEIARRAGQKTKAEAFEEVASWVE